MTAENVNREDVDANREDVDVNWEDVRRDFPVTERIAYLNSAAAGAVPRPVAEAARRFYTEREFDVSELRKPAVTVL